MNLHLLAGRSVLLCLITSIFSVSTAEQPTLISFEWLSDLPAGATGFNATTINANGDYGGNYFVPRTFFGSTPYAYSYVDGNLNTLISGQSSAVVTGINDSGQLAGYYNTPNESRGFTGGPASVVSLDLGQQTRLFDINNAGVTAGYARNFLGDHLVFRSNPAGQFANYFSNYMAINDNSVVAGVNQLDSPASIFIDRSGATSQLGLPSASAIFATVEDINNSDNVVGFASLSSGTIEAYVYEPETGFRHLPKLSGHSDGIGAGVDDAGHVVGETYSSNDDRSAVVWVDDMPYSLNDIVGEAAAGGSLTSARDIAENGWIVGTGSYNGFLSLPWRAQVSFGADELRWIDPAGGQWDVGEKWDKGAAPASRDTAFFELPATYTVTLDEDTEVGDLNFHAGDVTLDYGTHKIESGPLSVTGTGGGMANLSVGADVGVIPAEHGLVASSITVGAGGSLRNFSSAQFFVGHGDFPTGDPNSDQANTDLRALEGLRVENGGQLQTPHAKVDGPASDEGTGVATATIDGAGSTWRALSLVVGQTQTGRVEVTNGGQLIGVDVGSESLSLEAESPNANSQSLIRVAGVAGPNAPSTLRAADITLGIDHVGRLEAVDGALVAADVLRLAIRPMARGTAVFRGAGTLFEGANGEFGRIKVADGGFGRLDIADGAVVHADVVIGDISVFALGDNRGFVYLTDTGSQLKSNMLTVGRQSYGEINIANGAQATATLVRLSEVTNGEGVANLSGMGSQLTIGLGGLNIGSSMGDGKGVLNVTNGAVVDVIADGLGSTNVDSAGTINLRSGGKLRTTTLQTIGKITIEGADSHLTSDIGIVGEGSTITIDGGQLTNREEQFELRENDVMTVRNGGRVNTARWIVGAGSHVTLTGNGTLVKLDPALSSAPPADPTLESGEGLVVGTVNISNGARIESERLLVAQGGVVTGDDGVVQLAAGGALVNDGSLEQGTSPGTLTIDGDLVQTDLGQIVFEIAGLTPDELHDQLIVTGDAFIAGKVIIEFLDGFAPSEGDTFDLLNVAGTTDLSGVEFEIANLAPGFRYDISLDHGGMRLVSLNNGKFVPEPATLLLVALGLFMGAGLTRRVHITAGTHKTAA